MTVEHNTDRGTYTVDVTVHLHPTGQPYGLVESVETASGTRLRGVALGWWRANHGDDVSHEAVSLAYPDPTEPITRPEPTPWY